MHAFKAAVSNWMKMFTCGRLGVCVCAFLSQKFSNCFIMIVLLLLIICFCK